MKKLFSLLAAVLFAGSMMAEVIVIDPADHEAIPPAAQSTGADIDITMSGIGIAYNGSLNAATTSAPADFRVFGGKTLTLSASSNISKVVIAGKANKAGWAPTVSDGTITTGASYDAVTEKATLEDPLFVVEEIGAQSITITCNKQLRVYKIQITIEGGSEPTMNYYVAGSMTEWAPVAAYKLAANPAVEGEYMGEFTFAANDEFKVAYSDGATIESTNYFPNGIDNNYVITEAGDYTVYFRPDGQGGEDWHYGYINAIKKEAQDINVNISGGLRYDDYVAAEGWWQIYGGNEQYIVSISNVSTTQAEGTYTIDDLDADYTYLSIINGTDTTDISFVDGSVALSVDAQTGDVTVAGTLVGNDGNNYIFNLQYIIPTPQATVDVNIQNAELIDFYADYGLYGVSGEDANGVYVQLAVWAEEFQGQFTEEDFDMEYIGSGLIIGNEQVNIYTAAITVTPGNGGDYSITATLLCYNNTQYNITMYVPATAAGLEGVDAAVKAIKRIENGQVVIYKNGVRYNAIGQIMK